MSLSLEDSSYVDAYYRQEASQPDVLPDKIASFRRIAFPELLGYSMVPYVTKDGIETER